MLQRFRRGRFGSRRTGHLLSTEKHGGEIFERLVAQIPRETEWRMRSALEIVASHLAHRRSSGELMRYPEEIRQLCDALTRWAWYLELAERKGLLAARRPA